MNNKQIKSIQDDIEAEIVIAQAEKKRGNSKLTVERLDMLIAERDAGYPVIAEINENIKRLIERNEELSPI